MRLQIHVRPQTVLINREADIKEAYPSEFLGFSSSQGSQAEREPEEGGDSEKDGDAITIPPQPKVPGLLEPQSPSACFHLCLSPDKALPRGNEKEVITHKGNAKETAWVCGHSSVTSKVSLLPKDLSCIYVTSGV